MSNTEAELVDKYKKILEEKIQQTPHLKILLKKRERSAFNFAVEKVLLALKEDSYYCFSSEAVELVLYRSIAAAPIRLPAIKVSTDEGEVYIDSVARGGWLAWLFGGDTLRVRSKEEWNADVVSLRKQYSDAKIELNKATTLTTLPCNAYVTFEDLEKSTETSVRARSADELTTEIVQQSSWFSPHTLALKHAPENNIEAKKRACIQEQRAAIGPGIFNTDINPVDRVAAKALQSDIASLTPWGIGASKPLRDVREKIQVFQKEKLGAVMALEEPRSRKDEEKMESIKTNFIKVAKDAETLANDILVYRIRYGDKAQKLARLERKLRDYARAHSIEVQQWYTNAANAQAHPFQAEQRTFLLPDTVGKISGRTVGTQDVTRTIENGMPSTHHTGSGIIIQQMREGSSLQTRVALVNEMHKNPAPIVSAFVAREGMVIRPSIFFQQNLHQLIAAHASSTSPVRPFEAIKPPIFSRFIHLFHF